MLGKYLIDYLVNALYLPSIWYIQGTLVFQYLGKYPVNTFQRRAYTSRIPGIQLVCTSAVWYLPGIHLVCTSAVWYSPGIYHSHMVFTGMYLVCVVFTWYSPGIFHT